MATPRRGLKHHCHNPDHLKQSPKDNLSSRNISQHNATHEIESDYDETDRGLSRDDSDLDSMSGILDETNRSKYKMSPNCRKRKLSPTSKLYQSEKKEQDRDCSVSSHSGSKMYPDLSAFKNNKRERPRTGPSRIVVICFGILFLVSIVIVPIFIWKTPGMFFSPKAPPKDLNEVHSEIKRSLKVLSNELTQTRHFWTTVGSNVADVVEDSPPQPSIILALVPKDSEKTAACLFQRLTEEISYAFEDTKMLMYDGLSGKSPGEVSHELEDFFKELQGQHTAVIHNLEKLPPQSAMILHAFCDNENAPYKKALIILTMAIDLHYNNLSLEKSSADRILENLWRDSLRDVDAAAIISRIANSPVVIKPENHKIIDKMCPYK